MRTNPLSIRIAAHLNYSHATVQEQVIGLILANHKRPIVSFTTVGMMDNSARRQWSS
jgi:hypothetical protein